MSAYEIPVPIGPARRDSMAPALVAAIALHMIVFAIFAVVLKPVAMLPIGSSVPINIVSSDTLTNTRPAVASPVTAPGATPEPVPEAPPEAPPPPAAAKPAPALPAPAAKPTPAAVKPALSPTPTPAPTARPFSLDDLERSIHKYASNQPARPAAAPRGPSRPETAPQARPNVGTGVSQSQLEGLQQLLGRLWNPCVVVGGENVKLKATYNVDADGQVVGQVSMGGAERSGDPMVFAAARRAIDAIHQVEPYAEPFRGQRITVNFDAQRVCANQ